ncbi:NADH-quinone reductase [Glaciecola sp. MH2013]|nr:NADH-quinone reductase [Glaciecola sp. MH2013]
MSDLSKKSHVIEKLEVQSFEMNVYLVRVQIEGQAGFVTDKKGSPMRFHNSQMVRDMFEHCEVQKAVMLHDSPYDEMIGNPMKASDLTEMPFSMQQPY